MFFGLDCEDISALINKEFFSIFWEKKNTKNKTERYQEELFGRFVDKSYTDYKTCKYTASEVTPPQHTMCGKPCQTHCFPTEPVLKQRQKVHRMRESSESEWRAHLPVKKNLLHVEPHHTAVRERKAPGNVLIVRTFYPSHVTFSLCDTVHCNYITEESTPTIFGSK